MCGSCRNDDCWVNAGGVDRDLLDECVGENVLSDGDGYSTPECIEEDRKGIYASSEYSTRESKGWKQAYFR